MGSLEWWAGLSAWIRYPVALLVIIGSTIGLVTIEFAYGRFCGAGWAIGFILLWYGPFDANKKGYHHV